MTYVTPTRISKQRGATDPVVLAWLEWEEVRTDVGLKYLGVGFPAILLHGPILRGNPDLGRQYAPVKAMLRLCHNPEHSVGQMLTAVQANLDRSTIGGTDLGTTVLLLPRVPCGHHGQWRDTCMNTPQDYRSHGVVARDSKRAPRN